MTPFERYWSAVPHKIARRLCEQIWARKKLDSQVETILADIETRTKYDDRWLRGFIPNPATYLRQERWTDEIVRPHKPAITAASHAPAPSYKSSPVASKESAAAGIAAMRAALRG